MSKLTTGTVSTDDKESVLVGDSGNRPYVHGHPQLS